MKKEIDLLALKVEMEKFISLMNDPQYGLVTWNEFVKETLKRIRELLEEVP